jgi:hypothetical protein
MLNERDGGIGGVKIAVEECETGYKKDPCPRGPDRPERHCAV